MGIKNYLIEGVSGAGKTAVAEELQRRGYQVFHGDRTLAYLGDPDTGLPLERPAGTDAAVAQWQHENWIWDVGKVEAAVADQIHAMSFFCGGSRNYHQFIQRFDRVFVLHIDKETLDVRLASRPENEFGSTAAERLLIGRLHASRADVPPGAWVIDATAPLTRIVDDILGKCAETHRGGG